MYDLIFDYSTAYGRSATLLALLIAVVTVL
jgi:hypothetical protein